MVPQHGAVGQLGQRIEIGELVDLRLRLLPLGNVHDVAVPELDPSGSRSGMACANTHFVLSAGQQTRYSHCHTVRVSLEYVSDAPTVRGHPGECDGLGPSLSVTARLGVRRRCAAGRCLRQACRRCRRGACGVDTCRRSAPTRSCCSAPAAAADASSRSLPAAFRRSRAACRSPNQADTLPDKARTSRSPPFLEPPSAIVRVASTWLGEPLAGVGGGSRRGL